MIFVTNAEGRTTYCSPEWEALTGIPRSQADDLGWVAIVHPDDRELVRGLVLQAAAAQCSFCTRYRLLHADGRYVWMVAGAQPSFCPDGHSFIGFLGSVSELAGSDGEPVKATGQLGRAGSPPPPPSPGAPATVLDLVADHLLATHALVASDGHRVLLPGIEALLYLVGCELAGRQAVAMQ